MRRLLERIRWALLERTRWGLLATRYGRGGQFARNWRPGVPADSRRQISAKPNPNPLWDYFTQNREGPGIWKWEHYFDVYHRHFAKLVGADLRVLEIGVYSGGSVGMWKSYFGPGVHVYGVDIEGACKVYESERVTIKIGDQEDRSFWRRFNAEVRGIDVVIDDGGHTPNQMMATLEEVLPNLRPGGVYVCEDVRGIHHGFFAHACGLVSELNRRTAQAGFVATPSATSFGATSFQSAVHSIHFYPFMVVIEKHSSPPAHFVSACHGTQWQPFMSPGQSSDPILTGTPTALASR